MAEIKLYSETKLSGSVISGCGHVLDSFVGSPQEAPIWEITGAEFSKSEMHTADGISIRFPRMTRIRDDKDWKSATNLHQLKVTFRYTRPASSRWLDARMLTVVFLTGTLPCIQREL